MKKLFLNLLILLTTSLSFVFAQEKDEDEKQNIPFQISFLYPLGINGTNTQVSSNASFNVLWGINGGVNYFELGGIANINNDNVNGLQISGITNLTKGNSNGLIISGITNLNSEKSKGLHLAGINNYSNDEMIGAQISGIANVAGNSMNGAQIGLTNTVRGKLKGAQVGLINYSDSLKGTQVGLINIVKDGASGTSIGLINIVKNGYYAIEIAADASIWGNINFKMGTERFYTIFKGGYTEHNNKDVYTYGLGFGTMLPIAKRLNLAIDLSTSQLIYNGEYKDLELNLLSKADLNVQYNVLNNLSIFVGPSINVYTSNYKISGMETVGTLDVPEHAFCDNTSKHGYRTAIWLGGQAGINFSF